MPCKVADYLRCQILSAHLPYSSHRDDGGFVEHLEFLCALVLAQEGRIGGEEELHFYFKTAGVY